MFLDQEPCVQGQEQKSIVCQTGIDNFLNKNKAELNMTATFELNVPWVFHRFLGHVPETSILRPFLAAGPPKNNQRGH